MANRIRSKVVNVCWPSQKQMQQRGCLPYVEYRVRSDDVLWRVHFMMPPEHRNARPNTLSLKTVGDNPQLSMLVGGEQTTLHITHKAVVG